MPSMDRRLSTDSSNGFTSLQKKLAESRRPHREEPVPDLTDFMNDMFFGSLNTEKKGYNLTGGGHRLMEEDDDGEDHDWDRSSNSKLTQQWLREAKQMVASSPSRCESPSRSIGSPKFMAAHAGASASLLDRRDPLSRSARRHRAVEGCSGEILSKSAKHTRTRSETPSEVSPASAVQKWFSNILKTSNHAPPSSNPTHQTLAPRLSTSRRSRFQDNSSATHSIPVPATGPQYKRTFKSPAAPDTQLLSPPKYLIESAHRRSISSSTCSFQENQQVLSPPRILVESAHRHSISSSTCSIDNLASKVSSAGGNRDGDEARNINEFLQEQRIKLGKIMGGESSAHAKIVLSGHSNSTSSMVAAICYAWLLENRMRASKKQDEEEECVVVPVMNIRRGSMWKLLQAAWLFRHVGIDATALLFSDEVDLEGLAMAKQLSILVVGHDILRTNGEVGSQCTILTDNYCEDAYDLLQTPALKNLLLAGILLDTGNLDASVRLLTSRDAEAVQLLLVGSVPNYRNNLFDQLMEDQRDNSFFEALRHNYGKPPIENGHDGGVLVEHTVAGRKSTSISCNGATSQKAFKTSNCVKNAKPSKVSPKSDGHDGRALVDHTVSERKSTSVSRNEATTQNVYRKSNDVKNAKPSSVSPKSAKPKSSTVQAPTVAPAQTTTSTSGGKNVSFLAKWFGFGSK